MDFNDPICLQNKMGRISVQEKKCEIYRKKFLNHTSSPQLPDQKKGESKYAQHKVFQRHDKNEDIKVFFLLISFFFFFSGVSESSTF
jgi:hypothetical protein